MALVRQHFVLRASDLAIPSCIRVYHGLDAHVALFASPRHETMMITLFSSYTLCLFFFLSRHFQHQLRWMLGVFEFDIVKPSIIVVRIL